MRPGILVLLVVLAASAFAQRQPAPQASDPVRWGKPVDGLRLGIEFGAGTARATIRVLLENVAGEPKEVRIGHNAGQTIYDSMQFIATAPDGKQQVGLHRSLYIPIAGLVLPYSVQVRTGSWYEVAFPLTDIIFASGRTTATLDGLLKQGCSIRVQLEATESEPGIPHPWKGKLQSAELPPER